MASKGKITEVLQGAGWEFDRWGHLRKQRSFYNRKTGETLVRDCRVKLQPRAVRYEVRVELPGGNEWSRIASDYYSKVRVDENGDLWVGAHVLTR